MLEVFGIEVDQAADPDTSEEGQKVLARVRDGPAESTSSCAQSGLRAGAW